MESEAQRKRREAHDATSRWCPADCPHCARARAAIDAALDARAEEAMDEEAEAFIAATSDYLESDAVWLRAFEDNEPQPEVPRFRGRDLSSRSNHAVNEIVWRIRRRITARAEARKGGGE